MSKPTGPPLIGLISDTHGVLAPEVEKALRGVQAIIHAGDIDTWPVYQQLGRIAPVFAVRGNMDHGPFREKLPVADLFEFDDHRLYVIHDYLQLDIDPISAGVQIIVCGHTHRPEAVQHNGVWIVNPGSASFPRGGYKPTIALLQLTAKQPRIQFVEVAT